MQTSSTFKVENKAMSDVSGIGTSVGLSGGSALVSFFAETLPVVQWLAACVAIVSGLVGIAWVGYQYAKRRR
jgi:hypothetical protein